MLFQQTKIYAQFVIQFAKSSKPQGPKSLVLIDQQ
jgi:hypothetical protein